MSIKFGNMLCNQLMANIRSRLTNFRQFSLSTTLRESINPGSQSHKVDGMEKRFLVWTGKYKSVSEVPDYVSPDVMERARNRMRIRIANIMMALTVFGCIAMVISGKRASERGESVTKENLDWHKKYNEQKALEAQQNSK